MQLKTIFSALALSACFLSADAQQIFKISQFTEHNFLYNPAAAGANDQASVGATYRKMWSGIEGGPQTMLIFGDKYFEKQKTGVAVALYTDKTGPTSRTGGQVNLSYSVPLGSEGQRLMLGLSGQVLQYKIDMDAVAPYLDGDPALASSGSVIKGDAGAGIYLKTPTINLGASVQQIIQPKLKIIKPEAGTVGRLYRHYFFTGSYNWKVDTDDILIPNAIVKYEWRAPVDIEAGLRLEHKDLVWVGISYHYQQAFNAYAGVKIDHKFSIGYAYDQYRNPLGLFDHYGGAHEFSLRYFFIK